jgi:hypothetical protein
MGADSGRGRCWHRHLWSRLCILQWKRLMGEEGKAETQLLEVLNLVWSSFEFKKGVIVPVLLFFFSFLPISFLFIFVTKKKKKKSRALGEGFVLKAFRVCNYSVKYLHALSLKFLCSAYTKHLKSHSYFFVCLFFETGFHCVTALAVLELTLLEPRDPPASAFWVLGLKACATTARLM